MWEGWERNLEGPWGQEALMTLQRVVFGLKGGRSHWEENDRICFTFIVHFPVLFILINYTCSYCLSHYEVHSAVVLSVLQCSAAIAAALIQNFISLQQKHCVICTHLLPLSLLPLEATIYFLSLWICLFWALHCKWIHDVCFCV